MIVKLGPSRYQPRIYNGFDPNGKRIRVRGEICRTRKEAEKNERAMFDARDRGFELVPSDLTIIDLIEAYIAECEKNGLADKTLQEYRGVLDCRFRQHLGPVKATKWKRAQVNAWVTMLLAKGGRKKKTDETRPLNPKTVKHAMALGNAAYRFGKRMEIVYANPFEFVKAPKVRATPAKILTDEEVWRLQEAAKGSRWETFVTVALWLGPRRGETIALDWSAYDEAAQTLSVHSAMAQTRKHGIRRKETKTGVNRSIPVPVHVAKALVRQKALQAADELAAPHNAYLNPEGSIFSDEIGRRYTPMAATNAFQRLARKAKLSTTRLHDLRHHAATSLLRAGTPPTLVAEIMGHKLETLLRTYTHEIPDAQREKREALERFSAQLEAAINAH